MSPEYTPEIEDGKDVFTAGYGQLLISRLYRRRMKEI
jgi:hypothetical protein